MFDFCCWEDCYFSSSHATLTSGGISPTLTLEILLLLMYVDKRTTSLVFGGIVECCIAISVDENRTPPSQNICRPFCFKNHHFTEAVWDNSFGGCSLISCLSLCRRPLDLPNRFLSMHLSSHRCKNCLLFFSFSCTVVFLLYCFVQYIDSLC